MASSGPKETLNPAKRVRLEAESDSEEVNEEEEDSRLEEIEREVKEMAQRIVDFRSSIPKRLGDVVSSARLALLRPKLHPALGLVSSHPARAESSSQPVIEACKTEHEKLNLLRKKAQNNIAAAPVILKKVNRSLARINNLVPHTVSIHPAFKMQKKH